MHLDGKRVFVVEDDAKNLAIIAVTLKKHGAIVIQDAWNSGSVDMLMKYRPIDIILMDLMLRGGRSGYDIIDQIRAEPKLADIPIVIVSASNASSEMNRARQKGCQGYIEKPIDYHTFARSVADVIAGQEVWGSEYSL
ncbi:MAG: response regulator [Anaerolineae bacterium]|nr:response regulator [Anaerolineae bacterium]